MSLSTPVRSKPSAHQLHGSARGPSLHAELRRRELCGSRGIPYRPILQGLYCDPAQSQHDIVSDGEQVPPFSLEFCPDGSNSNLLAVADEDGTISILDSDKGRELQTGGNRRRWRAHNNAIFSIEWVRGRDALLTGSGDQSCCLWDINTQQEILRFRGHTGSVKAVSCSPSDSSVFSSGARDGAILLWDMRTGTSAVGCVENAHVPTHRHASCKRKRWQPHSVSSLLHMRSQEHWLVSAGASDGAVKLWDCRTLVSRLGGASGGRGNSARKPAVLQQLQPTLIRSNRVHGIVSLALDRMTGRMAVSSTDHCVYVYDSRWTYSSQRPHSNDVMCLRGHFCDSFYVKSAFSPDGRFILHGSSDKTAYIWDVEHSTLPPLALNGHTQEVTGVAWNPSDLCTLATASDDQSVRIWRVDRERGNVNTRPNVASHDERLGGSPLEERHAESAPQESSSEAVEAPSAPVRSASFNDQPETPTTGRQASNTQSRSMPSRAPDLRDYFARVLPNTSSVTSPAHQQCGPLRRR